MKVKVFSGRSTELEAGYEPHLEGVFRTLKEGQDYVKLWTDLYPKGDMVFWAEG